MSTANLRITLLGAFNLAYAGVPIASLYAARLQSLIASLLFKRGVMQSRQQLAFLFWPETSDAQAQTNLRQLLHTLRKRLPSAEDYLLLDERSVGWRADAAYTLDMAEFEQALDAASTTDGLAKISALEQAVKTYVGDLLPGCYDEWIIPIRERLAQAFVAALEQLILLHEEHRNFAAAILHAQRLLLYDPLHEATYRQLMRLFALTGDRAAALRVYHTCVSALAKELDVPPNRATRELYEGLLRVEGSIVPSQPTQIPFIGRQLEWRTLQTIWQRVHRGNPHVVVVQGEAGIGKTRLVEEMVYWAQQQGIHTLTSCAYTGEHRLVFAPLVEWLRNASLQPRLATLSAIQRSDLTRLLPELLLADPSLAIPEALTERWQRQRFFEAAESAIVIENQPLLLALDDLHWCDEETLAWLLFLIHHRPQARLLLIATMRNDALAHDHPLTTFLLELQRLDRLRELPLAPLDAVETTSLAESVAEQRLDASQRERLFAATEGNPLFIVETMRVQLGNASTVATPLALPPKVQAVIRARLAQLSSLAHELVQAAAVIGRSFQVDLLTAVVDQDLDAVVRSLDELWQRRIVREQGISNYDFSHDRLREVAYAELAPARRRLLHQRLAQALEQQSSTATGTRYIHTRYIQLAHHYEQSGLIEAAIANLQQAASAARQLYSYRESVACLERAIGLTHLLPSNPATLEGELELQMALCHDRSVITNYLGAEIDAAYQRALALCRQLPNTPHLFTVYWGLHEIALYRGEYAESLELSNHCLRMAEELDEPDLLLQAHHALWSNHYYQGQYAQALAHVDAGLALYQYPKHEALGPQYGLHDPAGCALGLGAQAFWQLGFLDQAVHRQQELLEHANRMTQLKNRASDYQGVAEVYHLLHLPQLTQTYAEITARIGKEQGYPGLYIGGAVPLGWSLAMQGKPEEGVALIEQAIADDQAMGGQQISQTRNFVMLAETYLAANRPKAAITALEQGIATFARSRNLICAPDLWTLKGVALLAMGATDAEVEQCYLAALSLAQEISAKTSELRAATQLARLWQRQSQSERAHQLLSTVYGWFSEGFEFFDLRTASQLLNELTNF